jgi:hypothetical protein
MRKGLAIARTTAFLSLQNHKRMPDGLAAKPLAPGD